MKDLVSRLEKSGVTTGAAFLDLAKNGDFGDPGIVPGRSSAISRFEGLFVPGTYRFSENVLVPIDPSGNEKAQAIENAGSIVNTLLDAARARHGKLGTVNGITPYEQLILASMVEKEAVADKDYATIAQVFIRRFKGGGRLASCPTVEYALGYHRPFLTHDDVSVESPYNVYLRKGLPPTPICFFSDSALDAVRKPANTNYYYFVYDWTTGELAFAAKYEDHLKNADIARTHYLDAFGAERMTKIRYDLYYGE